MGAGGACVGARSDAALTPHEVDACDIDTSRMNTCMAGGAGAGRRGRAVSSYFTA